MKLQGGHMSMSYTPATCGIVLILWVFMKFGYLFNNWVLKKNVFFWDIKTKNELFNRY